MASGVPDGGNGCFPFRRIVIPLLIRTGSNAGINQHYLPVFFLCQTYEGVAMFPNRTIAIPENSLIFMPIINWISILHHDGNNDERAFLQ